ncbi:hypothetical protein [Xanthomonas hortorum]|uniref:hypothetical protein n=1 Tax=Xanthomonas hortorum TaxID=56454 RepID=UPI001F38A10B|nr:hypothetical protein [Xanthomonas hortorum]MCE4342990.1 hypothetical protein [Xanthomonas hortorum pv. vitians]MCE4368246.1 hypothetical protein [Xanthomonas hortorum pv. vitians]MCE4506748.1 hypothetical protein [Xanthomonas hortorum pv. vitians]
MSSLPPPLPPLSSVPPSALPAATASTTPSLAVKQPLSGVALGLIGVLACLMLFGMLVIGALLWLIATGWSLFADQARAALQDDAVVQEQIGQIHTMRVDLYRTGLAPGGDDFVFNVEGDRGSGRVHATWVSVGAESETLTNGTLTMRDGSEYALPAVDAENTETETETETETDSADSWEQ